MEKPIIKAISIFALALFGLSFAACGSKKAEEEVQDQYVYSVNYKEVKTNLGEMNYTSGEYLKGNMLYYVVNSYDENYSFKDVVLYAQNIDTNEKTAIAINDDRYSTNSWISKVIVNEDGSFYTLVQSYDEKESKSYYKLIKYSKEGNVENEITLNDFMPSGDYSYVDKVFTDNEGNIIFNSNDTVVKLDKSGKLIGTISVPNWLNSITVNEDGKVYIAAYDENGSGIQVKPVNDAFNAMGEALNCNANNVELYPGPDGKLILSGDSAVRVYDLKTNSVEDAFEWLDVDLDRSYINSILLNEDGTFSIFQQVYDDNISKYEYVTIKKEKATPENQKQIIKIGCMYLDDNTKSLVSGFNKTSDKYRVKVVTYNDQYDDYQAAKDALAMDFTSGKLDVVELDGYNKRTYEKGEYLVDLNKYIDKDEEINRADYFDNLLRANEVDGKLFTLTPNVVIQTLAIPSKYSNGKSSWSIEDFIQYRNEHMDIPFSDRMTKETAMYMFIYNSLDEFVDEEKADCNFTSEKFYKTLELCNSFPKEVSTDDIDDWEEIRNGNTILTSLYLYDMQELQLYSNLMDSGLTIIGYPTSEGSGTIAYSNNAFGISAKSKNADAAWEFLRTSLMSEYQTKDYYNGFPVLRSAFEDSMEKKMAEKNTYIDEDGVVKEYPVCSYGNGFSTIDIYAPTIKEVDLVRSTIEGITKTGYSNEKITEIIYEEVSGYFDGQKSAEDVANIIQSRVKIYLAESK